VASSKKHNYDVVIVGYGPTGQACASLLARMGHRVCVFERWPTLYGLPRLIGFDAESARMLQAAGDVNVALRESFPIRRYVTYDRDMQPLVEYSWADDHQCGYPIKTATYQPYIEDAMDEAARDRGVRVNTGWRVTRVVQDADGVDVTAEPWSKEEVGENLKPATSKTVRAKYVVGADGAKSVVREILGSTIKDFGYRDAWLSIDIERREPLPEKYLYGTSWQVAEPNNVLVVVPAGTKRMRFELQVDPDADHSDILVEEAGYRLLAEHTGLTRREAEIVRLTIYPFTGMLVDRWRADRVFLAGDAAHLMPPFLGEGAASGMRDATTLAWKLDLVLRDRTDAAFLDTYQQERYPHVAFHVAVSVAIGEIVTERDADVANARNEALRDGPPDPPPADPTLTEGVLLRDGEGELVTRAGELAPQGWVHLDGATGRFDDVVGWGFHLVVHGADPRTLLDESQLAFLEDIGGSAVGVRGAEQPGLALDIGWDYERWFASNDVVAFVMRPDFYLFGTVRSLDDVSTMVDALRDQLGYRAPAGYAAATAVS
jgi:3-(3-hydroxy-phenyl)propionate hydroxylase